MLNSKYIFFKKLSWPFIIILVLIVSLIFFSGTVTATTSKLSTIKQVSSSKSDTQLSSTKSSSFSLPSKYDLRTQGRVSPVKDQSPAGTCWTFATMGSLESCLLTQEKWSFSENNMKNLCSNLPQYKQGFDRKFNAGGTYLMSMAYLARYSGPVTTSMDPYNPYKGYSPLNLKPVKHFQESIMIPSSDKPGSYSALKLAVMKYGAVAVNCRGEPLQDVSPFYNSRYASSYYPGSRDPRKNVSNHAVCIVGWDDSYNKNKFNVKPQGNGAFIIKNSWGTGWGQKGYAYISYYDKVLSDTWGFVFMGTTSPSKYKDIYQYDPYGLVNQWGYRNSTAWFSNVFKASRNGKLSAVSFYNTMPNSSYVVYIYQNPPKDKPTSGVLAKMIAGKISTMGYKTISLGGYAPLTEGQTFSVVVKLISPEDNNPVAVEYPKPRTSSRARALPGQSYVSPDGITWKDFTRIFKNGNVCLKAFAV